MIENLLVSLDSSVLLILLPLASVCLRSAVLILMLVMQKFVESAVEKRNVYLWHVNCLQAHLLYLLMNPQQVSMHMQNCFALDSNFDYDIRHRSKEEINMKFILW